MVKTLNLKTCFIVLFIQQMARVGACLLVDLAAAGAPPQCGAAFVARQPQQRLPCLLHTCLWCSSQHDKEQDSTKLRDAGFKRWKLQDGNCNSMKYLLLTAAPQEGL